MSWRLQLTTNLVATFCGVLLALFSSDYLNHRSERRTLAALFLQAQMELKHEASVVGVFADKSRIPSKGLLDTRSFDELAANPLLANHAPEVAALLRGERRLMSMSRDSIFSDEDARFLDLRVDELKHYLTVVTASGENLEFGYKFFEGTMSETKLSEESQAAMLRFKELCEKRLIYQKAVP